MHPTTNSNLFTQEFYRALFDNIYGGIVIIDINSFKIIDANKRAIAMFEYTLDEIRNLTFMDLMSDKNKPTI